MKPYETGIFFDLNGKTAIVTGGGNGIGKGACETLAAFGANVVVSDLKSDDAAKVRDGILSSGGNAVAATCCTSSSKSELELSES